MNINANAQSYNLKANALQDTMPAIQQAKDHAEERRLRKQQQIACLRLFSEYGYDTDIAGHFAVRDPEHTSCIWVNPMTIPLRLLTPDDLLLMDHNGDIVEGVGPVNLGAYVIHSRIHASREDIVASVHFHSPYGKIWSAFGAKLPPINQDACAFYDQHVVYDVYNGVPQDVLEGDGIVEAMGDCHTAVLQNHGLLTTATTIAGAAWRFVAMERACEAQIKAEATGRKLIEVTPDVARNTQEYLASEHSAWLSFQPAIYEAFQRYTDLDHE